MIILAVDTSTARGSVAVTGPDGRIVSGELDPDQPHSQTLLPGIEGVLARAGLSREGVKAVAVGTGPGAFTGLRVGLATMKGWSAAAGLPMIPVVSMDAAAFPLLVAGASAVVVSDARKEELYAAYYTGLDSRGLPVRKGEIHLVPVEEAGAWIEKVADSGARITGTGLHCLTGIDHGRVATGQDLLLAEQVLELGVVMAGLEMMVEAARVVPTYVRPPDALPPRPGTVVTGSSQGGRGSDT